VIRPFVSLVHDHDFKREMLMKPRSPSFDATSLEREPIPAQRSRPSVRSGEGVKTEICFTINRPREELFAFWRNFENLPFVMEHVESVERRDEWRSHWRVRRSKGKVIEWDAEVVNEHPAELIAWRTLEGSDVRHAGTIRFTPAPGGWGTEVKLAVEYEVAGGTVSNALAKMFRCSPEQQMREDLRHFKQLMEAGEIPTTAGQPTGRADDKTEKYEEAQ
jgi:uncharacterized membrane protein